jgi:hypothetical protein
MTNQREDNRSRRHHRGAQEGHPFYGNQYTGGEYRTDDMRRDQQANYGGWRGDDRREQMSNRYDRDYEMQDRGQDRDYDRRDYDNRRYSQQDRYRGDSRFSNRNEYNAGYGNMDYSRDYRDNRPDYDRGDWMNDQYRPSSYRGNQRYDDYRARGQDYGGYLDYDDNYRYRNEADGWECEDQRGSYQGRNQQMQYGNGQRRMGNDIAFQNYEGIGYGEDTRGGYAREGDYGYGNRYSGAQRPYRPSRREMSYSGQREYNDYPAYSYEAEDRDYADNRGRGDYALSNYGGSSTGYNRNYDDNNY